VAPVTESESIDTLMTTASFSVGVNYGAANGPSENALVTFPIVFDWERDRTNKDLSRVEAVFDMPLSRGAELIDWDDNWSRTDELLRRVRSATHLRLPWIRWD
jgi:hypothetical protein